jgi:hypothetical protein
MATIPYPETEVEGFLFVVCGHDRGRGDALVRGPDGGVATLIWATGEPFLFDVVIQPGTDRRCGTYAVRVPLPLTTDKEAADYLRAVLPELRQWWEVWRQSRRSEWRRAS